jgi:hypothetical protein
MRAASCFPGSPTRKLALWPSFLLTRETQAIPGRKSPEAAGHLSSVLSSGTVTFNLLKQLMNKSGYNSNPRTTVQQPDIREACEKETVTKEKTKLAINLGAMESSLFYR